MKAPRVNRSRLSRKPSVMENPKKKRNSTGLYMKVSIKILDSIKVLHKINRRKINCMYFTTALGYTGI